MKIKIKAAQEYNEQQYLIAIICTLLVPVFFIWICSLFAPGTSPCDVVAAFFELGNSFSWSLIVFWLICLSGFLYQYLKIKKMPAEKDFSEICFDSIGICLTGQVGKQKKLLVYSYKEIESLNVDVKTNWQRGSTGIENLVVERIDLVFKILSTGKTININFFGNINYLYKILDYHKKFDSFNYKITNPKDFISPDDPCYQIYQANGPAGVLVEQIEFYKARGKKEIFPKENVPIAYVLDVVLFYFFVRSLIDSKNMISDTWLMILPTLVIFIAFLTLLILIVLDRKNKM